jgi:hypothetical protein
MQRSIIIALCAASTVAHADATLVGRVTDLSDQPVKDATVIISGPNGVETTTTTDPTGRYVVVVKTSGPRFATFTFGNQHVDARIDIPEQGSTTLDAKLEIGGEVIQILDLPKPLQHARPKSDPLAIPPYSDRAMLSDVWAKAWLLLDVDDRGTVTQVKFLARPGNDLDAIAVKHAFGLRFDPAHDRRGNPIRSLVVWPLEWPSWGWMMANQYPLGRLPNLALGGHEVNGRLVFATYPPCGKGGPGRPLNLGAIHPALRDCTAPDLAKANADEPWYERDAGTLAPVVAPAPVLDPRQVRIRAIAEARSNRTKAFVATALTGAALAGTIFAWTQDDKWSNRVNVDMGQRFPNPSQLEHDRSQAGTWDDVLIGSALSIVVGGIATAYFWDRATTTLSLRPEGGGVMMSLGGGF